MIKKIFLTTAIILMMTGCVQDSDDSKGSTADKDNSFNLIIEDDTAPKKDKKIPKSIYSYIPKGDEFTQEMAYKFLNMASFGATPKLADELRKKGVVKWVDEQLNMQYNPNTDSTLRQSLMWAQQLSPDYLANKSIDDILAGEKLQAKSLPMFKFYVTSSVMGGMLEDKAQLRQRVAYALSQTIIASHSVDDFFRHSSQALAYYYDFLLEHAFGNYSDVLYDVSLTPAMATFLTYNGNQKEYVNDKGIKITPDENYGRELMQLFTIGLYELNIDGMQKGTGTKFKETYTQKDVNEMSKVFTGLTYSKSSRFGGRLYVSDTVSPLECVEEYHDREEKHILGTTIVANQSCEKDIQDAVNILISHDNIAPFISKKLIMRLTKSNPKGEYIKRVAQVFNDDGNGVKGNLKAVTKAIFLDKDIWEDITNGYGSKMREPFMAYLGVHRAFDTAPIPTVYYYGANGRVFAPNSLNKFYSQRTYYYDFAQAPLHSPTVFNFYSDDYVPNSNEFRMYNYVAPELEIQTTSYMTKFAARIDYILRYKDLNHVYETYSRATSEDAYNNLLFSERSTINTSSIYEAVVRAVGGDINKIPVYTNASAKAKYREIVGIVVDSASWQLLGKRLSNEQRKIYIDAFSDTNYVKIYRSNSNPNVAKTRVYIKIIIPIIRQIILSDEYMVQ